MTAQGYRYLFSNHLGLLLIAFISVFSSNLGQSFFIGLFQNDIASAQGWSAGQFGSAYAGVTLISAVLVMFIGPKVDWLAPQRFALFVLIGLLIGIALLTSNLWFGFVLLGLGLVRFCGQGLFIHFGNTLAGREFQVARGRALSLVSLGVPLGEIFLPLICAGLLIYLSWQQVWWVMGGGWALIWILLFKFAPWPAAPLKFDKKTHSQGPRPLKDRRFWLLLPLLMAMPIIMTGLMIYQSYLTADLGAALTAYAVALTAMGTSRVFGALVVGPNIDRFGSVIAARLYVFPFAIALLVAPLVSGSAGLILLMAVGGMTAGFQEPVLNSLLIHLWGRRYLGRVRSTLQASMVLSTGIAPAVLGYAIDFGYSFYWILGGMFIFLFFAWLLAQLVLIRAGEPVND